LKDVVLTRSKSGHGNSSNGTFNQLGIERWRIPGWNARRLVNVIQGIMSLVDLALILGGTHTRSVDLETGEVMVPGGSPVRAPCEQAGDSQDEAGLSTVHISAQVVAGCAPPLCNTGVQCTKGVSVLLFNATVRLHIGYNCSMLPGRCSRGLSTAPLSCGAQESFSRPTVCVSRWWEG
jgi:hypothetical protein